MADLSTVVDHGGQVANEPAAGGSGSVSAVNRESQLIFDWNEVERKGRLLPENATFFDETLRDGLQNPSVKDPTVGQKLALLHLMEDLGIHGANVGLPSSSPRAFDDVLLLCKEVVHAKMTIKIACAGRTVASDITPMIEVSQKAGLPLEAYVFIGSSPIRQYVERWDLALIAKRSADAINVAVKGGLSVAYVTEDTTRSRPEVLTTLFKAAIDHGASRLCLSDTVGHATPDGVRNLIRFAKGVVAETGAKNIGLDWHGHNDRGLALVNALWAFEFGADRVHGTGLGIGERVGNAQMELILLNLKLLGQLEGQNLTQLVRYCARGGRRFPYCDWRARGGHSQGGQKRSLACRPRLQRRPRRYVRQEARDLHRFHERGLERELLARRAGHPERRGARYCCPRRG
jgi:2-isopropylmalate synthase